MKVYEGHSRRARARIAKLSGYTIPEVVRTETNLMLVVFKSDFALNFQGFKATWTVGKARCI